MVLNVAVFKFKLNEISGLARCFVGFLASTASEIKKGVDSRMYENWEDDQGVIDRPRPWKGIGSSTGWCEIVQVDLDLIAIGS